MVSPGQPMRKTKIFVGRLPENCRSDELRQIFLQYGEVTECDVMNRYAFVHMAREEDADAAIKALHNSQFKGATINVEHSTGKSRGGGGGGGGGRRDDRRAGPMRGGRGGRDGGRDGRPGPYNDRRVLPLHNSGYDNMGGGGGGGYNDYNRGGGDFGGRGDFGGGYNDRGGYGQNAGGNSMGGGYGSNPPMGGGGGYGHGHNNGPAGNYGPSGGDYGRNDYGGRGDFGGRNDYAPAGGMGGDNFGRSAPGPVDYGRPDNFPAPRNDPYPPRAEYERPTPAPMRNGTTAPVSAGGYQSQSYNDVGPVAAAPSYNTTGPNYNSAPGPQGDMFSRRGGAVPPVQASSGYGVSGGYNDSYDRPDPYGPPRSANRFPGPAEPMPPRY